jgi:hypothetical protein
VFAKRLDIALPTSGTISTARENGPIAFCSGAHILNAAPSRSIDSVPPESECSTSTLSDSANDIVADSLIEGPVTESNTTFALNDVNDVRLFCQFFNIPMASSDDIRFLLIARTNGLETAKALADGFQWSCDAARRSLAGMIEGNGVHCHRQSTK